MSERDVTSTHVFTEADVGALIAEVSSSPGPAVTPATEETLTCPECGTLALVDLARRRADDFCAGCDYPMFWARPHRGAGTATLTGDEARRRLPGALGTTALATVPCPACAELNVPSAGLCARCGADMDPPPPPVPLPPPAPEPVVAEPERPVLDPPRFPWWWLAASAALFAAILGAAHIF